MSKRTTNPRLRRLYHHLRCVDWDNNYELFKTYRVMLAGATVGRKYANASYQDPYRKGHKVAGGLIAKLISGCWKTTNKKRLVSVNRIADNVFKDEGVILQTDFKNGTYVEKAVWMLEAMRRKFIRDKDDKHQSFDPFYESILLEGTTHAPRYPVTPEKGGLGARLMNTLLKLIRSEVILINLLDGEIAERTTKRLSKRAHTDHIRDSTFNSVKKRKGLVEGPDHARSKEKTGELDEHCTWTLCYDCRVQCPVDLEITVLENGKGVQLCRICYAACEKQALSSR